MRKNKNRTSKIIILALITFCLPIFFGYAFAQNTQFVSCMKEAATEYNACIQSPPLDVDCRDQYDDKKDSCDTEECDITTQ